MDRVFSPCLQSLCPPPHPLYWNCNSSLLFISAHKVQASPPATRHLSLFPSSYPGFSWGRIWIRSDQAQVRGYFVLPEANLNTPRSTAEHPRLHHVIFHTVLYTHVSFLKDSVCQMKYHMRRNGGAGIKWESWFISKWRSCKASLSEKVFWLIWERRVEEAKEQDKIS